MTMRTLEEHDGGYYAFARKDVDADSRLSVVAPTIRGCLALMEELRADLQKRLDAQKFMMAKKLGLIKDKPKRKRKAA